MITAQDGFVDLSWAGAAWCVTGVRLEPDPTIARNASALGLPEEERRRRAVARERAWLTDAWAPDGRCWELRYRPSGRHDGRLDCALLARAHGPTPEAARTAAYRLREHLDRLPSSVRAIPLDTPRLTSCLRPFEPAESARPTEIRPRVHWSRLARADAAFPYGLYVDALAAEPISWEPLWTELTRINGMFTLGIRLEPMPWRHQDAAMLDRLITEYSALERPGRFNPAIGRQEAALPFAQQAVARYSRLRHVASTECAYRLRATLACADQATDQSAAQAAYLLAAAFGGPGQEGSRAVVRPVQDLEERRAAWYAFTHLHDEWLPRTRQQEFPYAFGEFERMLADRVGVPEASAVFRLPTGTSGHLPLFTVSAPAGATTAPATVPPGIASEYGLPQPPPGFTDGRTP
ncbi:hypothetical protein ABUW04_08330 [Streptacidiphilus sp. N1-10]|uniref:YcaO domain-containing protein n=1 Tax=Streptacidiphilus jeojiensis TaxID=3229225 RepID=A0ABV6XJ33_9ACTN